MRAVLKSIFARMGFDVVRLKNSPRHTLLGLKAMSINTIIDVGANEGQFAKEISHFFPNARLYCFEPLPSTFEVLNRWAHTQQGRVLTFNLALGGEEGQAEFFWHTEHSPSSSLLVATNLSKTYYPFTARQKSVSVRVSTLDNILCSYLDTMEPEILVKLDVQGYEDRVLQGGQKILARSSACLLEVCVDRLYERQAEFKMIVHFLGQIGFNYAGNLNQIYAEDGHVIFLDAVFVKNLMKRGNEIIS